MNTEKKSSELVAAVARHAETLRSLLRRNPNARDQDAIRSILEAHEGCTNAREEEIQREVIEQHVKRERPH